MVRPLPTGFLLPIGALSLNLTWQIDSESQQKARARGLPGGMRVLPRSLVQAPSLCSGFLAGRLHQAPGPQALKTQATRLRQHSLWCGMPRSENPAFLLGLGVGVLP